MLIVITGMALSLHLIRRIQVIRGRRRIARIMGLMEGMEATEEMVGMVEMEGMEGMEVEVVTRLITWFHV